MLKMCCLYLGLNDLERIEIDRLREENVTLKQALDQVTILVFICST